MCFKTTFEDKLSMVYPACPHILEIVFGMLRTCIFSYLFYNLEQPGLMHFNAAFSSCDTSLFCICCTSWLPITFYKNYGQLWDFRKLARRVYNICLMLFWCMLLFMCIPLRLQQFQDMCFIFQCFSFVFCFWQYANLPVCMTHARSDGCLFELSCNFLGGLPRVLLGNLGGILSEM